MFELFQMWALVEALGLMCLPLTIIVFRNLPDRGWAFSKTLGMALFAFCVWFPLMSFQALPFSQLLIAGIAVILLVCGLIGILRMQQTLLKMIRLNLGYILIVEGIFLGMVFLLGWLRSYGPDIRSYEMFMDEGFIASILRSPHLPPGDMWFSGYPINYYYYAHFTIGVLAKLLGQTPSIAFNTGICIFFGLTAANLFGVTSNIVAWARHLRARSKDSSPADLELERPDAVHPPLLGSVPYGLLTMVMGLVIGNLATAQQWFESHGDWTSYDWFSVTRVIGDGHTINEFPAFSFLLSCFHAHVLALAFTIMAIGMAFNLLLEKEGRGLFVFGRGATLPLSLGVNALILGGLFTMNGWDYPTYMGLALLCIAIQQWLSYSARVKPMLLLDILLPWICLVALSFLFYVPFYLSFVSPSQGIGLVPAEQRSPLQQELLIYGLFAFVFLSLLLACAAKRPMLSLAALRGEAEDTQDEARQQLWFWIAIGGIVLFLVLGFGTLLLLKNSVTFVLAFSIALLGVILMLYHIGNRALAFTVLLGATAFALVAGCEILFLKDVFADGDFLRMNTVFKFYFQAWALLSIACGAGLYFILTSFQPEATATVWQRRTQRAIEGIWVIGLLLPMLASLIYPLVGPAARYRQIDPTTHKSYIARTNNLDGLTYLATDPTNPGDYDAIRWLNANVQGTPTIVESIGDDYKTYGRISAFTGLPTPMGWVGHEYQWRVNWLKNGQNSVEFNRRGPDVEQIYTNPDPQVVLSLMAHYQAQYLYVGSLEYAKYPNVDLHRFSAFMQIVYNAEGVTIYKVK